MFTSFVYSVCSQLGSHVYVITYMSTKSIHNFCSQLVRILFHDSCSHLLFWTSVHNSIFFKTLVHNSCSQFLLKILLHNCCSISFINNFQYFCAQLLFTNFVQVFRSQLLFTTHSYHSSSQLLLKTSVTPFVHNFD